MKAQYTIYVSDNTKYNQRREGWFSENSLLDSSKHATKFATIEAAKEKIIALGYEDSDMAVYGKVTAYVAYALN